MCSRRGATHISILIFGRAAQLVDVGVADVAAQLIRSTYQRQACALHAAMAIMRYVTTAYFSQALIMLTATTITVFRLDL